MALNIKNSEVQRLAAEVSKVTGETKTEAIRKALIDRKARLSVSAVQGDRRASLIRFLERDVWPLIPRRLLGRRLSRREHDQILGYGPGGV
ncbi:MAG: type II toxin-antitoxin system VapB family antitoxin [Acidobacteria bacterium]|nr:type II toxin-antitoxin system VapB family antitoxin [Acidobacteriota bacterium]